MLRCGETYNLTTVLPANACRQPRPALYPSPSTMKLQPDKFDVQSIKGMGPGWIELVAGGQIERIEHSLIMGTRGERLPWHCPSFADLTAEHLAQLAQLPAEVLLLGSGQRNRFVPASWLRPLVLQNRALETMDTAAACRTYNVLASEGRHVLAALLLEPAS